MFSESRDRMREGGKGNSASAHRRRQQTGIFYCLVVECVVLFYATDTYAPIGHPSPKLVSFEVGS
jgi:hypothetical protein